MCIYLYSERGETAVSPTLPNLSKGTLGNYCKLFEKLMHVCLVDYFTALSVSRLCSISGGMTDE